MAFGAVEQDLEGERLAALRLAGDTTAGGWLKELLDSGSSVSSLGRLLLSPGAKAPAQLIPRGKVVCNCIDVTEQQIAAELQRKGAEPVTALERLQGKLRCGTQCGSCLPELRRMIAAHAQRLPQ